ncbi:hypothetical protein QBC43DRAFT_362042 [Cladorrhinum sp. PSN259]|nr:hypothetical protein QBC43DRAFT_362042 [Cladorrhinum sp. PSN259]
MSLRSRRLFQPEYLDRFAEFVTTRSHQEQQTPWLSLEYIHNKIHNFTRGLGEFTGHMNNVPLAAFDPIFWLHYAARANVKWEARQALEQWGAHWRNFFAFRTTRLAEATKHQPANRRKGRRGAGPECELGPCFVPQLPIWY